MNRIINFEILITAMMFLIANAAMSQGIYFDPSPTDVTGPVRLYVDITSSECNCAELQDADPISNPLYIWAWNPNEARQPVNGMPVTNGEWTNSNENLEMTQDETNPDLWYFDFLGVSLVEFYDQPAAVFYSNGIDFLLKESSGAAGPSGAEQKSPDLNVIPEPVGCFEKICPFPTVWFQDEYFVITYDNNKETNSALQNLGPDECLIWYQVKKNGGAFQQFQQATDKFKMEFDGDGIFSKTMIPQDYFNLSEGDQIDEIKVFITKAPIQAPPFTQAISLIPGCQ